MQFLLDDNKVYIILGIVFLICLIIYYIPNKNTKQINIIPITAPAIVGYVPRYFNNEIYSMPNAKGDPYVLYGSNYPNIINDPSRTGYERLIPAMENLPQIANVQTYVMENK